MLLQHRIASPSILIQQKSSPNEECKDDLRMQEQRIENGTLCMITSNLIG